MPRALAATFRPASSPLQTATGDKIVAPNKTDPLLQVGDFYDNDVDLSVTKIDAPDPYDLGVGGPLTYTVEVKNNSGIWANNVMVTDTLDANTTFVSASDGGTHAGGVVTWDLGALAPFGTKTLTLAVNVSPTAPVANVMGTDPIAGSHVLADIAAYDLLNKIEISSMNDEPLPGNNKYWQPTNVLPRKIDPTLVPVTKTATPAEVPEPGGIVTFTATVKNDNADGLWLTSFVDDVYGDLNQTTSATHTWLTSTCDIPRDGTLDPGRRIVHVHLHRPRAAA